MKQLALALLSEIVLPVFRFIHLRVLKKVGKYRNIELQTKMTSLPRL